MVPLAVGTPDQRLGDPPGELLRRVRLQAVARPDLALRRPRPVAAARPRRRVRAHARGPRPARRAADRLRCPRPATRGSRPPRACSRWLRQDWPLAPDLALVKSPVWDQAEDDLKAAFAELAETLGERITEVDLPEAFASRARPARADHGRRPGAVVRPRVRARPRPAVGAPARHHRGRAAGAGGRLRPRARAGAAAARRRSIRCSRGTTRS